MEVVKEGDNLVIRLNQEPKSSMGLRPTVDKMMESVAKNKRIFKIGVILTGMGSDGTKRGIMENEKKLTAIL